MKARITDFILTALLLTVLGFQNCGYEERGHSNTPAEYPGAQNSVGVDTVKHPGNIDRDTIKLHQ